MNEKKIYLENLQQDSNLSGGDAGLVFTGACPECGDVMIVTEHGWRESIYSCGISWEIELYVWGNKKSKSEECKEQVELDRYRLVKPPIGLEPRSVWVQQRTEDLANAIQRHIRSGFIDGEYKNKLLKWCTELKDLIEMIQQD